MNLEKTFHGLEMGKHACRLYHDDRAFVITGLKPVKAGKIIAATSNRLSGLFPSERFNGSMFIISTFHL